jgi:hypothetical protein
MIVKVVNDLTGPNGLVLTPLIFNVYPRLIKLDLPFLSVVKKVKAIKTIIKELQ